MSEESENEINTLGTYRVWVDEYSSKASEINRQLAFAGIGIIWLFKKDTVSGPSIPNELFLPGALLVAALAFDLLHYIAGYITWGLFVRIKEIYSFPEGKQLDHEAWFLWPMTVFFIFKFLLMFASYGFMFRYLLQGISGR